MFFVELLKKYPAETVTRKGLVCGKIKLKDKKMLTFLFFHKTWFFSASKNPYISFSSSNAISAKQKGKSGAADSRKKNLSR